MTFVSYAQNFEDVLLWRALGDVASGFYIDVGAAHPDTDSVTRAFYERGWSGIDVEPVPELARRLAAARPRDLVLPVAVSDRVGTAAMLIADATGRASIDEARVSAQLQANLPHRRATVACTTLAELCRQHVVGDIHFLRIDAAGAERACLAGADLRRFRPWVILVQAEGPADWEPVLHAADYGFAWFDGLNRFYLAAEQAALGRHFAIPPNAGDGFVRAADSELIRRIGQAEAQAAAAETRGAELVERLWEAKEQYRHLQALYGLREDDIRQLLGSVQAAEARATVAADWAQALRGSTSWRVTKPLRSAIAVARAVRGATAAGPDMEPALLGGHVPGKPARPPMVPDLRDLPPPAVQPPGRLRRAVHQFHSGSAVGDAITNAMLLTRDLLRGCGYASEIYCEFPDAGLGGALRPLDELPVHDGYVLIVRHSIGYGAFERIRALPAPKVLIYHNITPPHLLGEAMAAAARQGRAQLAQWRGAVAAALADSEYNALELHRLGFEGGRACTLLFDLDAMRTASTTTMPAVAQDAGVFTVLFVGRVAPAKGQLELVAAFARFCAGFDAPARLVLLGRYDFEEDYAQEVRAAAAAAGIAGRVELTGLLPDAERDGWLAQADLYVSLSWHEGFGVPLVEAAARGLPVLALAAGAVPYTLAATPEALLPSADLEAVAAAMLALARDLPARAALAARQAAGIARFAVARQLPVLLEALAAAGAAPPADPERRRLLAASLSFAVTGHFAGSYSLAAVNRRLALALDAARPGRVRVLPIADGLAAGLDGVDAAERTRLAPLLRAGADSGPNVVISQHYPLLAPADPGDAALALFFWEESLVPAATVAALNGLFRGVLAPSRFVAKALVDSGVSIPVHVVGFAPDLGQMQATARERDRAGRPVTFLHVSSCFPRKGVDVLLRAYATAFRRGDPVRLVIKGFANPHNDVAAQLAAARAADAEMAEVELIEAELSGAAMQALYREADAMVLPTRGEGFNIPAAEAMAAGIPLLVTAGGGQADFCRADNAGLIDYRFAPAQTHLSLTGSVWMEPDADALAAAMRALVDGPPPCRATRVARAQETAAAVGDGAAWAARIEVAALDVLLAPPRRPIRIGWVSTWNVRCGIAEYSRNLLDAMPAHPGVAGITVLADMRSHATMASRGIRVRPAWDTAEESDIDVLAAAIAQEDADVVMIQHQPGLIKWPVLTALLARPALRHRPTAVTLHTTRHLQQLGEPERGAAVRALAGIARVLVHTVDDLNVLKGLGLVGNVTLLPHGTQRPGRPQAARPITPGAAPLIGCYGFFLDGKGIAMLIGALGLLRARYPSARLRLVNAEYGSRESAEEIAACRALVARERLGEAVEFETAFMPHADSLALLAECDVVALPYQHSRESSSAAMRTALCAGVPVAVTPLPLFDEAGDAVARLSGFDAAALAAGLEALLADAPRRMEVQVAAQRWLAERSCTGVAGRLLGMLLGLAATPAPVTA